MWGTSVMKRVSGGGGVGRFLSDWRARRKVLLRRSPDAAQRAAFGRRGALLLRGPSNSEDGSRLCGAASRTLHRVRDTIAHPRRGHAAATASKSQLTIRSAPPVGAAKEN